MARQPGGDTVWTDILVHRLDDSRATVIDRFVDNGVEPHVVRMVLADLGSSLCVAASTGADDWAEPFGGQLAVALLAAEVSAYAAHLNSRASAVRARAVDALLDEFSAVTVATRLGVSRQKVYEIGRPTPVPGCAEPTRGGTHG